jgi:aryl-alcohol dehydrogenase-like predicted oxidoreductase
MDKNFLGRTGLQVSELCLGTMTFGPGTDEPTAHRMLDSFVEAGGTSSTLRTPTPAGGPRRSSGPG